MKEGLVHKPSASLGVLRVLSSLVSVSILAALVNPRFRTIPTYIFATIVINRFMTRSSQHISVNILEFDDDFERTLRRKRKQPEPNPSSSSSEAESEFEEEEEEVMAADNRTIKELSALGLANVAPLCIQYPLAAQGKTNEFELKSSLLHHIPKYHGLSMEDPNKHLKEFEVFFPISRVILLRKKINGIQQSQGKSFLAYYERFKALVASCPQHQMKEELLLQYFYEKLLPIERQMLDASAGGALVDKTPMAVKTLIANRALNAQQYEGLGQKDPPQHQVNEMAEGMKIQGPSVCDVCSMQGHLNDQCHQLIENGGWESTKAVGFRSQSQPRNDPYFNTYNPGWKDHPNFKWRELQQPSQQGGFRQTPPGVFQRPYAPPQVPPQSAQINSGSSLDNDTLLQLLNSLTQGQQNQAKEISEVKRQIGQISEFMGQFREEGKLPSPTIVNPNRGFETAKAITLRSGKEVGTDSQLSKPAQTEDEKLQQEEDVQNTPTARKETTLPCTPTLPKPSNSTKKLCTTRKQIREKKVVHVSDNVSALLQRKLSPKCKDPGSFTIPCVIGNTRFDHAMLDLGASINVMPYSVYASMNLGELKNDGVIIQLADRSNAYPKGVLEDVLVEIFMCLTWKTRHTLHHHHSYLGPFMKTAQTKIDVAKGAVTMAFGGDMINFNVSDYVEKPNHVRSCFAVDVVKNIGQEPSTPIKNDAFQTTNEEGIGVDDKECTATILKTPNLAENTPHAFVDCAAISLQHIGKLPIPNSIPISTNRSPIESKLMGMITLTLGCSTPQSGRITIPFHS
ncbi:unnamed protein product [Malus baccata var. baccata]